VQKTRSRIDIILDYLVYSITAACILAAVIALFVATPIVNLTGSVPVGMYLLSRLPIDAHALHRGAYVVFCPTRQIDRVLATIHPGLTSDRVHGNCKDGRIPFIKEIAALPGDTVQITAGEHGYVAINGVRWPHSLLDPKIAKQTAAVGNMRQVQVVPQNQVWAMGVVRNSVDSRYFGAVPVRMLQGIAVPIATDSRSPILRI
jgi:conjugative transfer signal peptidase TraF